MKRFLTATTLILICGLGALPALAAFENVSVSPRVRGMGDSGVAVGDGAFAPYLNPAALGQVADPVLGTSYLRPYGLEFADLYYLGGSLPLKPGFGGAGLGIRYFDVNYGGESLLKETTFTLGHGLKLYEDIHSTVCVGYALNLYRLEFGQSLGAGTLDTDSGEFLYDDGAIDPRAGSTVGLDAALLVTLRQRTRLGVMARNINNPQIGHDDEYLGQRINAGLAYEPYPGVITTFELENQIDGETQYHGGLELGVTEELAIRAGTMTNPNKLSGGFSYRFEGASLDYGFSTGGGSLDSSHQFGLSFTWGGEAQ